MNTNTRKNALFYAAKRFALYMAVGLLIAMQPYWMVIYGCLSVLLASLSLACIDMFHFKNSPESERSLIVFDKAHQRLLMGCVLLVVVLNLVTFTLFKVDFDNVFNVVFIGQIIVSILACIIFCFYFANGQATKRLAAYILIGLTAALFPYLLGIIMGFPLILMAGVLIVATDLISKPTLLSAPVFTKSYIITYVCLLGLMIAYLTFMFKLSAR